MYKLASLIIHLCQYPHPYHYLSLVPGVGTILFVIVNYCLLNIAARPELLHPLIPACQHLLLVPINIDY